MESIEIFHQAVRIVGNRNGNNCRIKFMDVSFVRCKTFCFYHCSINMDGDFYLIALELLKKKKGRS